MLSLINKTIAGRLHYFKTKRKWYAVHRLGVVIVRLKMLQIKIRMLQFFVVSNDSGASTVDIIYCDMLWANSFVVQHAIQKTVEK